MNKILALTLAATLALSLTACGGASNAGDMDKSSDNVPMSSSVDISSSEDVSTPEEQAPENDTETARETLLAQAEAVSFEDMAQAMFTDPDSAQATYCGKILQVEGTVYDAGGLTLTMKCSGDNYNSVWLVAELPQEDISYLESLETEQRVTVVGTIAEDMIHESGGATEKGGMSMFLMNTEAYIVK